jgi:hypothetical protein
MKKIIISLLVTLLISSLSYSQVRTRFFLTNPAIQSGYWSIELKFTVPAGQTWRVGSCNIRVNWAGSPNPANLSIHPDASVSGANSLLHNNSNYGLMTTTSILAGATISLNIIHNPSTPYAVFSPGTYSIGRLRWNRLDTSAGQCITPVQRVFGNGPSVVYDSLTQLMYGSGWDTLASSQPGCIRVDYLTGNRDNENELPTVYKLYNNYPNPFNPSTIIRYDLSRKTFVNLSVYDILGRLVTELIDQDMNAGRYEAAWNAVNFASGIYFYKLVTAEFTDTKKMLLIK